MPGCQPRAQCLRSRWARPARRRATVCRRKSACMWPEGCRHCSSCTACWHCALNHPSRCLTTLHCPPPSMAQPGLQLLQVHPVLNWRQLASAHCGMRRGGGVWGLQDMQCSWAQTHHFRAHVLQLRQGSMRCATGIILGALWCSSISPPSSWCRSRCIPLGMSWRRMRCQSH